MGTSRGTNAPARGVLTRMVGGTPVAMTPYKGFTGAILDGR
jgi:hypothetical protein